MNIDRNNTLIYICTSLLTESEQQFFMYQHSIGGQWTKRNQRFSGENTE